MKKNDADKRLDFIYRHFDGVFETFNADSAIYRAEQLVKDAERVKSLINESGQQQQWQPIEFPSYYIVGFVTCLEWHARSRLHDLLQYDPTNLTENEVRNAAAGSNLGDLLKKQLTVAQLVATTTLVSDVSKYLSVFDRILTYLKVKRKASDIAKDVPGDSGRIFLTFKCLFERRHRIVHEIDQTQVGHWNLREPVDLDEVEELGNAVIGLMTRLEYAITNAAKGDFPNLQHCDTITDRLISMITDIEDRIIDAISTAEYVGIDKDKFNDAIELSRQHIRYECDVLQQLDYPGRQYYDAGKPLITKLCKQRLSYLIDLENQLHGSSVIQKSS